MEHVPVIPSRQIANIDGHLLRGCWKYAPTIGAKHIPYTIIDLAQYIFRLFQFEAEMRHAGRWIRRERNGLINTALSNVRCTRDEVMSRSLRSAPRCLVLYEYSPIVGFITL